MKNHKTQPGCPTFTWRCQASSADAARDRFGSGPDAEGWEILSIARDAR